MAALVRLLVILMATLQTTAPPVGVCYGLLGDDLPPAKEVIALYESRRIRLMRLYDPNPDALRALAGSSIQLLLGVPNSDLQSLASAPANAHSWVQTNLKSHTTVSFRYIAVGNEVSPIAGSPTADLSQYVLPAMQNINAAIKSAGLGNRRIKVSTAIDMTLLGNSYPPSAGAFRDDVRAYMDPIIEFLTQEKGPLLANVYPYFSHAGNPTDIPLPYALFTAPATVVRDQECEYRNLFDAMVDAVYSALERAGGGAVEVVVSESGWPSGGGVATTVENARIYNTNLASHVSRGTPKRPGKGIETYLFAMFDENEKEPEVEKHWGLFFPTMRQKYSLDFFGRATAGLSASANVNSSSINLR
ncbi:lichenase-like isoform X2 [Malania oleifera]|uniref:lichenase-like isoform X2 n=1 Tax=Malania oleifera TaxID=397392 RepID=UPI0025AE528D|nr:lichenase-like isoform X2 [Malania oleifera]